MTPLYFLDGTQFATDYQRVVVGLRGEYIELTKEQIIPELTSQFNQTLPIKLSNEDFCYYWCHPVGRDEKVYWQIKVVGYADYKRDYYYICPTLLKSFKMKF